MIWTQATFGRFTLGLTALGFAVLLAVGVGFVWMVQETRNYAAAVVATQQVRVATAEVLSSLQDAETGQRGFLLTADEDYLAPYRQAEEQLDSELDRLEALIAADGGTSLAQTGLRDRVETKLEELRRTIQAVRIGDMEGAVAMVRDGRGKALMDEVRAVLAEIDSRSVARQERRSANLDRSGGILLGVAAVGLVLIALVALGSTRIAVNYTRDLQEAQTALRLANAGLEQRVADRTTSLMAANEEIQRFAYIVSHDLRAPLVNVMGFTQELETAIAAVRELMQRAEAEAPALLTQEARDAVTEDIPEAIGFIRSSTNRMDRLIGAILSLSREGRRRLREEPVAMQPLLESIAASLQHQLDSAGAEMAVQPPFPALRTDRVALEQILGNLLDNAVKYLDPARPGRIQLRARREAGLHAIDVIDNGRGIAARDHARVFELFRRSGPQDKPGEGIGLAHTRALARRMGGDIRLASTLGVGSTFTLLLPDALPVPDPASASRTEEQSA